MCARDEEQAEKAVRVSLWKDTRPAGRAAAPPPPPNGCWPPDCWPPASTAEKLRRWASETESVCSQNYCKIIRKWKTCYRLGVCFVQAEGEAARAAWWTNTSSAGLWWCCAKNKVFFWESPEGGNILTGSVHSPVQPCFSLPWWRHPCFWSSDTAEP